MISTPAPEVTEPSSKVSMLAPALVLNENELMIIMMIWKAEGAETERREGQAAQRFSYGQSRSIVAM